MKPATAVAVLPKKPRREMGVDLSLFIIEGIDLFLLKKRHLSVDGMGKDNTSVAAGKTY